MVDKIISWDKELFLFLNGFHNDFWDVVMFNISNKFMWIPLYLLMIYWLVRDFKKNGLWIFLVLILAVGISDLVSVHAFKNVFMRLRPCHDPSLEGLVHIVNGKCGGKFSFYSGHATNHFVVAVYMAAVFRKKFKYFTPLILVWAGTIAYSRIYLGVHFPLDVLAGSMAGIGIGLLGFVVLMKVRPVILSNRA